MLTYCIFQDKKLAGIETGGLQEPGDKFQKLEFFRIHIGGGGGWSPRVVATSRRENAYPKADRRVVGVVGAFEALIHRGGFAGRTIRLAVGLACI